MFSRLPAGRNCWKNLYRDNSMEALDKILPKEQQEGALEPSP